MKAEKEAIAEVAEKLIKGGVEKEAARLLKKKSVNSLKKPKKRQLNKKLKQRKLRVFQISLKVISKKLR